MGRQRRKDKHLPQGVYWKNGAYRYARQIDGKKKWTTLGRTLPEMHAALSTLVESAAFVFSFTALVAKYRVERLPQKAKSSQYNEHYRFGFLLKVFGHMRPNDIKPHHVYTYFRKRGETEGARHEVKLLSAILTFGRQCGAIDHENPCYDLHLKGEKHRTRYVTDDEYVAVRMLAPPMIGYAMDLAFICGMDRSTILRLSRSHLTDQGIEFERSKTETTREDVQLQVIRWTPELRMVVDRLLTEPPRFRTALISTQAGEHYTPDGFKTLWHRLMDRAVKGRLDWEGTVVEPPVIERRFQFRDLRAKSASDAGSDQEAADRLGHRNVALTQRVYRRLPKQAEPQALPLSFQENSRHAPE